LGLRFGVTQRYTEQKEIHREGLRFGVKSLKVYRLVFLGTTIPSVRVVFVECNGTKILSRTVV
jgi:hypothetical protein